MAQKLDKYIKENINTYFTDNPNGTVDVKFDNKNYNMGKPVANFLKTLVQKRLSSKKYVLTPPNSKENIIDTLNTMAKSMVGMTKLTPEQKRSLEIDNIVKQVE